MKSEDMDRLDDRGTEDEAPADDTTSLQVSEDAEADEPASSAEVDELRGELDSLNDRHLRLAAEFDNYRKRNERDRQAQAARLQLELVRPLLEVLDDLERVVAGGEEAGAESLLEGVRLVEKKFRTLLESAGLEAMDAEGKPFDPEVMEALMTVPTGDPASDGSVADVFQKGYRFRDTLVRPARVRVFEHDDSAGE